MFGAVTQDQVPASSDDCALDDTASVVEAVVNTFSQVESVSHVNQVMPEVVVVDEGDALTGLHDSLARVIAFFIVWLSRVYL